MYADTGENVLYLWCCFNTLQIDIPTLVTENLGKEGLKHLEMYLRAKEKGYLNTIMSVDLVIFNIYTHFLYFLFLFA